MIKHLRINPVSQNIMEQLIIYNRVSEHGRMIALANSKDSLSYPGE
jgi:hypothetical protein